MLTRVSIDPGMTGTGYAVWSESTWRQLDVPTHVGNLAPMDIDYSKIGGWPSKAMSTYVKVANMLTLHRPSHVYIEFPQYMGGDARGHTATAKGDTLKLASFCGMICTWCFDHDTQFVPYTPREWKGQLPKEIVITRIARQYHKAGLLLDIGGISSHSWDAVGVGLHAKGFGLDL